MSQKRGFTILEVLITTLLVGISIFALMEAMNRGIFGVSDVENYSLALSLTQRKLEEIKDSSFASINSVARAQILDFTTFDQKVDMTSLHTYLKQVDVTTYWTVKGGETSVSLSTKIANG